MRMAHVHGVWRMRMKYGACTYTAHLANGKGGVSKMISRISGDPGAEPPENLGLGAHFGKNI